MSNAGMNVSRPVVEILFVTALTVSLTPVMVSKVAIAQAPNPTTKSIFTVDIEDLSPKFLDFYEAAVQSHADPEQRWVLWKSKYDFGAEPPIPAGEKMAREQLDQAWTRYPEALSRIEQGASGLRPPPQQRLEQVGTLLGATEQVHIRLIAFVGTFRRNAFAMGLKHGVSTVAIPLEDSDQNHALDMTHEFTHAVQQQQVNWTGQTVASAIFTEGLAMHVTQHLNPGFPTNIYATSTPEWFQQCSVKLPDILRDLKLHLTDEGAQAVSKLTFGTGSAGLSREVYCGGWFVVGKLLDKESFAELGKLSRAAAEQRVMHEIEQMATSGDSSTQR